MKTGPFDPLERLGQINKAALWRHGKYAEGARDPKALAPGDEDSVPIIHQDQVGAQFDRESDRVFFARVQGRKRSIPGSMEKMRGLTHFYP